MKRKIRSDVNIAELLKDADRCQGEISLTTEDGDVLNLKSALSKYVLVVLANKSDVLSLATLNFEDSDIEYMKFYSENEV